ALIVGPWGHGLPNDLVFEQVAAWFDHHLRGIENDAEDRVLIFVSGPDQWRYEEDWPIPDAATVQLYFSDEQSGTIASINDGSLSAERPVGESEPVQIAYAPEEGPF